MRRVHPAYPDLLPLTHTLRPGFLPGTKVLLDPVRMAVVWQDAPRRTLPTRGSVPRNPVRAISYSGVAHRRPEILHRLLDRGSASLLVIDDEDICPADLGLDPGMKVLPIFPILPSPLENGRVIPGGWGDFSWGALLGLFPFPHAREEIRDRITNLQASGAAFVISLPLLLTPKDRHRILEVYEAEISVDEMENVLFHLDISVGLEHLEKYAASLLREAGIDETLGLLVPAGSEPGAIKTAAELRLWARRLDQSHVEGSRGWRLRRAAAALEPLKTDPRVLASENNLRIIPGFEPWVERLTRSLWEGGDPLDQIWSEWSGDLDVMTRKQ